LKSFDYVPPFRGRAIHMLDTSTPFAKLDLDFELLEKRKAAEYDKLNRVIAMAQGTRCREQEILEYFGQAETEPCGRCDNCGGGKQTGNVPVATDALSVTGVQDAVRVALSGVARTRGTYGKTLVAQMLCGSKSTKISKFNLQRLSTYGMLRCLKQDGVAELLKALISAGCLEQYGEADRPRLRLTELGQQVMLGHATLERLALPDDVVGTLRSFRPPADGTPRKTEASAKPQAESQREPESEPSSQEIAEARPAPVQPRVVAPVVSAPAVSGLKPSHYWTWRLLSAGFTVEDCQAIRGMEREVVLDHTLRAIDSGWPVDVHWFLRPEQVVALETVIGPEPPARIRPLLAKLPQGMRYEDVQLYLKCRSGGLSRLEQPVQADLGSPIS
jgi:ATP-dependent DNA helicase RecQ